jgi:hypothetical protein
VVVGNGLMVDVGWVVGVDVGIEVATAGVQAVKNKITRIIKRFIK